LPGEGSTSVDIDSEATILLKRESATFREKLPELLEHEGRYVLIHGADVVDTFAGYEEALRQGYRQFGLQPFLVKQIWSIEPVRFITRTIEPGGVDPSAPIR
jgi:hypothetical protein